MSADPSKLWRATVGAIAHKVAEDNGVVLRYVEAVYLPDVRDDLVLHLRAYGQETSVSFDAEELACIHERDSSGLYPFMADRVAEALRTCSLCGNYHPPGQAIKGCVLR